MNLAACSRFLLSSYIWPIMMSAFISSGSSLTAVKLDPELMNADIMMGQMYEDNKNREQAAKFIQAAVKKNPQNLKVLLDAAVWAMITNRTSDAQSFTDAALKVDPKSVDAQVLRGPLARMSGDLKTA